MVHSTTMKVVAESSAEVTPAAKSTGASVATRRSSAMRNSGILVVAADEVELIVAAACKPAVDTASLSQARQRRWMFIRVYTMITPRIDAADAQAE